MTDKRIINNRQVWEDWTHLHLEAGSDYQNEIRAFESGACTLSQIDLEEVGDVKDREFLHLMCHFGIDSLSWAKRGARVTGVDFSSASISAARQFAQKHAIAADFICADVFDLPESLAGKFDVVYTEGGILAWLPDMRAYAGAVARCLKPGGIFYIRDSHPFRRVIFPVVLDGQGELRVYHYFSQDPTFMDMHGSYAQPNAETHHPVYFWVHGIGEIVTELSSAGFHIEFLHEFPRVYDVFPTNISTGPGQFQPHTLQNWAIPSTFSLRARRMGAAEPSP